MRSLYTTVSAPLALAAVLCFSAGTLTAQTKTVSDAQVESDVLKGFAADSRVAGQPVKTSTVYGVVTLSGSVGTEDARDAAEQIASRTPGVKKVVDQLTVGAPQAADGADPAAGNSVLLSDGTRGPANSGAGGSYPSAGASPDPNAAGQQPYAQTYPQLDGGYPQANGYPQGNYPQGGGYPQGNYPQGGGYPQGNNYPQGNSYPQNGGYPQGNNSPQGDGYPQANGGYPDAQGNYPPPQRRLYRRDYERQMAGQQGGYGQGYAQGQPGGQLVTVPNGTVLPVAINRWLSSGDAGPGSTFTALVANDVLAGGQIAIPRGATVEGTVLDAKGAGVLKGRGMLTLQLNTLDLGGQRIPLQSEPFTVEGHDKTARSVTSTVLGAGIGALFGAAIGRGTGAAIGAGVGGAAGLGTAAASNSGQATLRPEELLRFRLTAPAQVTTVSEAEMQRLGGYAGPANAAYGPGEPGPYAGGVYPYAGGVYPYPATVGVYGAPYPYRYYRRGFYRGYWY